MIDIIPDAQVDLLGLQDYMLDRWGEASWLRAEDEVFDKLAKVDAGLFNGRPVQELASVGIFDYLDVCVTSQAGLSKSRQRHLRVSGRRPSPGFPTLMKRLLKV